MRVHSYTGIFLHYKQALYYKKHFLIPFTRTRKSNFISMSDIVYHTLITTNSQLRAPN